MLSSEADKERLNFSRLGKIGREKIKSDKKFTKKKIKVKIST